MRGRVLSIGAVLTVMLFLLTGLTMAQGPFPQAPAGPEAMVGNDFTYQGQLMKGGWAIDATCVMTFTLYDDASAGNLVGAVITDSVAVNNGLFNVSLDFGHFVLTGDARWLEIAVQCPGDASPITLTPRQALTATPYALSLRPGAIIDGVNDGGAIVEVKNNSTNIYTVGVQGESTSTQLGYGVIGLASATSGQTFGVSGHVNSPAGTALRGEADATDGTTYGVYGVVDSDAGFGVYGISPATGTVGIATGTTGETCGVYGETGSTGGIGVYGRATAVNGEGVRGLANRYAVIGIATASSGPAHGVGGRSDSDAGVGAWGYAASTTGTTYGVSGTAASTDGRGVYGTVSATSGTTFGVYGLAASTAGRGVYGTVSAASGTTYGVYGLVASSGGRGVAGHATATTGSTFGVLGRADSTDGYGVYYVGGIGGTGLAMSLVQTQDYGWRHLYSMASPDVLFEDVGTAQLLDGQATVTLDPVFAQTIDQVEPYQVFLTPQGDCGLYVAAKTPTAFTVQTLGGIKCAIAFDYRIVAKRVGYEDTRLAPAAEPPLLDDAPLPSAAPGVER